MGGMRGALAMAMLCAAITDKTMYQLEDERRGVNPLRPEDIKVKSKPSIVPAGCSKYYFDKHGNWYLSEKECREVAFETVALSKKSAQQKFDKWLNRNK